MAIDRMKRVTFLAPVKASQRLLKSLHNLGVCEVSDVLNHYPEFKEVFKRPEVVTEECDTNLQKVQTVLNLMDVFCPVVKGFIQGLAPVPLLITKEELDYALHKFDLESVYQEAQELDIEYRKLERNVSNIENQISELLPLEDLPFRVDFFRKPKRIKLLFGKVLYANYQILVKDEYINKKCAVELVYPGRYYRKDADSAEKPVYGPKDFVFVMVACLPEDFSEVQNKLKGFAFEEITLPNINGTVRDHIRELKADLSTLRVQIQEIASKVQKLSVNRRTIEVLKAFWENRKKMALARTFAIEGRWVQVLSGYVRERDLPKLQETLRSEMPEVSIFVEDPQPGEDVPVSITLPSYIKPVQLLVNMYGLPPYDFFDPSPYLMWGFYLFFGICFGDVAYGLILLFASLYLMKRTKPYEGVYNFSKLLFFASIPTIACGFLFGSVF